MVRPGRPMHHVHNWKLQIENSSGKLEIDPRTGFYGTYIERWWACIRGNKVKHISPSKEYPSPVGLYGRKSKDYDPFVSKTRVFLALSGSPYIVEDPY